MAKKPVICDTGTGMIKAGYAGDHEPRLMFPTLMGTPMLRYDQSIPTDQSITAPLIGDAANKNRANLKLTHPITNGIITHWEEMEAIWEHTFNSLQVEDYGEHYIVQTEAAMNPDKNRERMVQIMFEKFGFAGVNVSVQAICALSARGEETGFVVDSGDGVTHLVPVCHGYVESHIVDRIDTAGRHVTENLMKLLVGSGQPLSMDADFQTVEEMKRNLCYVALDLAAEKKLARETTLVDRKYTLPDTRELRIGAERFLGPELIFSPGLFQDGDGRGGLAHRIYDCIFKADISNRKEYFGTIMLSGGTTMFPGLASRLSRDLHTIFREKVLKGDPERQMPYKINIHDPPQRQHSVFFGAQFMGDIKWQEGNSPWYITKDEYKEKGESCVHRLICTKSN